MISIPFKSVLPSYKTILKHLIFTFFLFTKKKKNLNIFNSKYVLVKLGKSEVGLS